MFLDLGYKMNSLNGFGNHWDEERGKCFMELTTFQTSGNGEAMTTRSVMDAFEGKQYAEYMFQSRKGKRWDEVPPLSCRAISRNGDEVKCGTPFEFDDLVKTYMGDAGLR